MPIPVSCSHCNRKYQVRDELAGKVAKCQCGRNLVIPTPAQDGLAPLLDEESIGAAPPDPFAGIPDDIDSQGVSLSRLAPLPKKRRRRKKVDTFWIFLLGGVVIVGMLIGGSVLLIAKLTAPRWHTPQEVFAVWKKAIIEDDWKTLYETYCPKAQMDLLAEPTGIALGASLECEAFRDLCKKYGLPYEDIEKALKEKNRSKGLSASKKAESRVKRMSRSTKAELFADILDILGTKDKLPRKIAFKLSGVLYDFNGEKDRAERVELANVQIDGDKASGVRAYDGEATSVPVTFVKVRREWRIEQSNAHTTLFP